MIFLFEYFRLWMLVILWTISLMILCVFILWTQIMSRTGAHSCLLIIQVWAAETLGLAETSLPQIVFVCFIFVYLFISVFCICVYLLVLLFRFGRVVRHWAGCAETSTALHCPLHRWSFLRPGRGDRILHSPQQQGPEKEHSFLAFPILYPQGAWNHFHVPLIWAMA